MGCKKLTYERQGLERNTVFITKGLSQKEASVKKRYDYYPFGMSTADSWTADNTSANNYLYNAGSEKNTTTNNYQTAFRDYDPAVGRMTGVDIMAGKYSSVSPYNYAFNDPVGLNDPTGADPYASNPPGWRFENGDWYDNRPKGNFTSNLANPGMLFGDYALGSGGNWADVYNTGFGSPSLGSIVGNLRDSQYGGSWSSSSGYSYFESKLEASLAGARYNNLHDSWGNTSAGDIDTYLNNFAPKGTTSKAGIFVDKTIVNKYDEAISYLSQSVKGARTISYLQEYGLGLQVWGVSKAAAFLTKENIISWNWFEGFDLRNGGFHSPSLVLMHEFAHAYLLRNKGIRKYTRMAERKSKRWQDSNEKFASRISNIVASQVGQPARNQYSGISPIYIPLVNSIVPVVTGQARHDYNILRFKSKFNTFQLLIIQILRRHGL